jgi:hypothetical protein
MKCGADLILYQFKPSLDVVRSITFISEVDKIPQFRPGIREPGIVRRKNMLSLLRMKAIYLSHQNSALVKNSSYNIG